MKKCLRWMGVYTMDLIECPVCDQPINDDTVIIQDGALVCPSCGTPI
jgi:uncharacterized protein YbaR (Trm112 family)